MTALLTTLLISQLSWLGYQKESYQVYHWPEDEFEQVDINILRFASFDLVEAEKGERVCFVFEEISDQEVCGTITGNVRFGLSWVRMDVESR